MDESLTEKKCVPCEGGTLPLSIEETAKLLPQLGEGWGVNAGGHLYKQYPFKNFVRAMEFANKIATIAEQEKHHPDLYIAWGKCGVELWTHSINGLSENDFIVAAKIDSVFTEQLKMQHKV